MLGIRSLRLFREFLRLPAPLSASHSVGATGHSDVSSGPFRAPLVELLGPFHSFNRSIHRAHRDHRRRKPGRWKGRAGKGRTIVQPAGPFASWSQLSCRSMHVPKLPALLHSNACLCPRYLCACQSPLTCSTLLLSTEAKGAGTYSWI